MAAHELNAETMRAEKRGVARNSVFAAVLVTGLKFAVGFSTGSLGILSEAVHSSLDLIAAVVTLLSVRVSDKPADADHQYGHGKFESFSAFVETGLLLVPASGSSMRRSGGCFFRAVEIEPTLVRHWRSWSSPSRSIAGARGRLKIVAEKYDSQALQADALHFRTDIWSSAVVILGLVLVWLCRGCAT